MQSQRIYDRAKDELKWGDSWAGVAQGAVFQSLESFPEQMEKIPGLKDIAEEFFHEHLNPVGDKFVHWGAFYSGSLLTMRARDYGIEKVDDRIPEDHPVIENREEFLMASAFAATTFAGGAIEVNDAYFDMVDMAADYAGWYMACERYLDEGPGERISNPLTQDYEAGKLVERNEY